MTEPRLDWPPPKKTDLTDRSELIKDDILGKILSHVERHGFRGTSMRDIAEICGVTKPTIYYYYKNKNEILEFLYQRFTELFYGNIESLFESDADATHKMSELVRAQVMFSANNREFQKIFMRERHELDAHVRTELARRERQFEQLVKAVLVQGQKSGEFRAFDPQLMMLTILGLLSSVHRWIEHTGTHHQTSADQIVTFVMSGILAPATPRAGHSGA